MVDNINYVIIMTVIKIYINEIRLDELLKIACAFGIALHEIVQTNAQHGPPVSG